MGEKKAVLITIIVLLCIFLPFTIIGIVNNKDISKPKEDNENPRHELFYQGKLWFYDDKNKLISNYECLTELCGLAKGDIDDQEYNINYYQDGSLEFVNYGTNFAFISDGDIKLFNIKAGSVLTTYSNVKTYNASISNDRVIVKNNEGLWGVLSIGEILENNLPFEYDFIGLKNKLNEDNKIISDKFIVKKDNHWFIVNETNEILSGYILNPIVDYNDYYIISYNINRYYVSTFNNINYFNDLVISDYAILDNYIGVMTSGVLTLYDDPYSSPLGTVNINTTYEKLELKENGNQIDVLTDGNKIQSIAKR